MTPTVKVGSKELPIHFGSGALRRFEDQTGKNVLAGDLEKMDYNDACALVLAALEYGGRKAGQPFEGGLDAVDDLIDTDPEFIGRALNQYSQSMPQGKPGKKKAAAKR